MKIKEKSRFLEILKKKTYDELTEIKDDILFSMDIEAISIQTPEDLTWKLTNVNLEIANRNK